MNRELVYQLQAYLDNECTSDEAREISALLSHDPRAKACYEDLRRTKESLRQNEPVYKLPEPGDFYWSKIARGIQNTAQHAQPVQQTTPGAPWWMRLFAPAGVTLAFLALLIFASHFQTRDTSQAIAEIELPSEEASAITFHSEKEGLSVVWLQSQ